MSQHAEAAVPNYQMLALPAERIQEAGAFLSKLINPHVGASFLYKPDSFVTTAAISLEDNHLIGLSCVTYPPVSQPQRVIVLNSLAVAELYQQQRFGIGSKLLELVEQDALEQSMTAIKLTADPRSTGFFLRRGYTALAPIEPKIHTPFCKDLTRYE